MFIIYFLTNRSVICGRRAFLQPLFFLPIVGVKLLLTVNIIRLKGSFSLLGDNEDD